MTARFKQAMTSELELESDEISVTVNPAGAFTAYNDLAWADEVIR
jgi:hypothetical protein